MKVFEQIIKLVVKGGDKSAKDVKNLNAGMKNLAKSALAVGGAYFSAQGVINAMQKSLDLYARQEQAVRKLDQAMGGSTRGLQAYATQLQAVTRFGDEATIEQMAFLGSIGMTESQIRDIIPVAMDLATATGLTLESAVRNTAKTFSGLAGELGELVPQLRDLTAEEMKAGKAVEVMAELFGGQAQSDARSFSGELEQMNNNIGDLFESIGERLAPAITGLVSGFNDLFEMSPQESYTLQADAALGLVSSLDNVNTSMEDQAFFLKELEQKFPGVLSRYNTLKDETGDATLAVSKLTKELQESVRLQASTDLLIEAEREQMKAIAARRAAQADVNAAIANGKVFLDKYINSSEKLKKTTKDISVDWLGTPEEIRDKLWKIIEIEEGMDTVVGLAAKMSVGPGLPGMGGDTEKFMEQLQGVRKILSENSDSWEEANEVYEEQVKKIQELTAVIKELQDSGAIDWDSFFGDPDPDPGTTDPDAEYKLFEKNMLARFELSKNEADFTKRFIEGNEDAAEALGLKDDAEKNELQTFDEYVKAMEAKIALQENEAANQEQFITDHEESAKKLGLVVDSYAEYEKAQLKKHELDKQEKKNLEDFIAKYPVKAEELGLVTEKEIEGYELYEKNALEKIALQEAELGYIDDFIEKYPDEADKLGLLTQAQKENNAEMEKSNKIKQEQLSLTSQSISALANLLEVNKGHAKDLANIQAVKGIVDAFAAAQSSFAKTAEVLPPPAPQIAYGTTLASGLAQAYLTRKAATKVAAEGMDEILTEPTFILAGEAGPEYVNIDPLTNDGPGMNKGATVVFQGNVLSKDFIEQEAVPLLRNAIRKGGNIGIG